MYRDRAKERREKYGIPEPPSPTYSSPPPTLSVSKKRPSDNELYSNTSTSESKIQIYLIRFFILTNEFKK